MRVLRIMSCFGTQTDTNLLDIFEGLRRKIISPLDAFVEQGILNRANPLVIFTHIIISPEVSDGMSVDKRQDTHLEIGQFLGEKLELSCKISELSQARRRSVTLSFISLACNQANSAGPTTALGKGDTSYFTGFVLKTSYYQII